MSRSTRSGLRFAVCGGLAALACALAAASAQQAVPTDFEAPGSALDPLFSYFGGVQSFGVSLSPTLVYSGQSLRVWGNFRPDPIFRSAGIGVGIFDLASPALAVPSGAAYFSITIKAPPTTGQFAFKMNFVEDDDADGVLDPIESDDQWEITPVLLPSGSVSVLNIPLAQFEDANPGFGNDVLNIATTRRIALTLTFETKTTNPGGIVQVPAEFFIDHMGFYVTPQSIPVTCRADFNSSGNVGVQDIFDFLTAWFAVPIDPRADFNNSGAVGVQDIFDFLAAWFGGC
jgi:hypothetical protein